MSGPHAIQRSPELANELGFLVSAFLAAKPSQNAGTSRLTRAHASSAPASEGYGAARRHTIKSLTRRHGA